MLENCWDITVDLAAWLLLGTLIAALLHGLLPSNFVKRHLRGRGSVLKAVLLGVPLPLCSCGVIPAGLGLKKDGASDGASVGFLISTPQTGVDSIRVSGSFLGWPFAIFKVFSATVTGLVGGILANQVESIEGDYGEAGSHDTHRRDLKGMVEHGTQLLRSIWGWIVVGIVVSACIDFYIPESWLLEMAALGSLISCLAVLCFSMPLYVCATASVPIAATLVAKGLPASAALVFLMAGPASNVATIGAIYRGFGRKVLTVYLSTIVLGSIAFGLTFDWILTDTQVAHSHSPSLIEQVCAGLLLVVLAAFAIDDLRLRVRRGISATSDHVLEVPVQGLTCGGCVRKLTGQLSSLPGVNQVDVQRDPGLARVEGSIDEAALRAAIDGAGFQAS